MDDRSHCVPARVMSQNQERLLQLASMYKGLSRRKLAQELGRDASNLLPANGNPKLDYLVKLARVLDWPIGEVADAILGAGDDGKHPSPDGGPRTDDAFDELNAQAQCAHREGRYGDMIEVAGRLLAVAKTADQRALASLREAGGWDGLGRYMLAHEAVRRGIAEPIESADLRRLLQSNLANGHYTLWNLFEARGMACKLLDDLERESSGTRVARAARAFAHYVVGHASRRLMGQQPAAAKEFAEAARRALEESLNRYETLAAEFDHEPWRGIANTCRGGLLEV
ncbi:MAG: hypothetical protein HKO59_11905, partial [Phycisphaerales bacterium]|nr:hypothetical protein [Phycisphaerales bacterium]